MLVLRVVALGAGAYALLLACAPEVVDRLVFTPLGFGLLSHGRGDGGTAFTMRVLGAVLVGWMVLVHEVVRGPLADGQMWAWRALSVCSAIWFVVDTGMSLAVGFPTHAAFNVIFGIALGVPLWALAGRWQNVHSTCVCPALPVD